MHPKIVEFKEKIVVGNSLDMSLANNKTRELWQSFMPNKRHIKNTIGTDLYSIQVYDENLDFRNFTPQTIFKKHAKIEVSKVEDLPDHMNVLVIPSGLYAVFTHVGTVAEFANTFRYIMSDWLPKSDYKLDIRPHFEVLGSKYIANSDTSEEEVYVPIILK